MSYDLFISAAKGLVLLAVALLFGAGLILIWTAPNVTAAGALALTAITTLGLAGVLWVLSMMFS